MVKRHAGEEISSLWWRYLIIPSYSLKYWEVQAPVFRAFDVQIFRSWNTKNVCVTPPRRTNICTLHKRYTNWNNDLLFIILIQSSGKRRHGGENFIWESVRCLVALMVGSWVRRSIDGAMTGGKRSILAAIFCTTWSIIIWNNTPALFTALKRKRTPDKDGVTEGDKSYDRWCQ